MTPVADRVSRERVCNDVSVLCFVWRSFLMGIVGVFIRHLSIKVTCSRSCFVFLGALRNGSQTKQRVVVFFERRGTLF